MQSTTKLTLDGNAAVVMPLRLKVGYISYIDVHMYRPKPNTA